jgi:ferredoxin
MNFFEIFLFVVLSRCLTDAFIFSSFLQRSSTKLPYCKASFAQCELFPRYKGLLKMSQNYNVKVEYEGKEHSLVVPEDNNILGVALDNEINLPHGCRAGVCHTCIAKVVEGTVDQSDGSLEDHMREKGYALLCSSKPTSDCVIRSVTEPELAVARSEQNTP